MKIKTEIFTIWTWTCSSHGRASKKSIKFAIVKWNEFFVSLLIYLLWAINNWKIVTQSREHFYLIRFTFIIISAFPQHTQGITKKVTFNLYKRGKATFLFIISMTYINAPYGTEIFSFNYLFLYIFCSFALT